MNHSRVWFAVVAALSISACDRSHADPEFGVSADLAAHRATTLSNVAYQVHFSVPEQRTAAVTGTIAVSFTMIDTDDALVLDFRGDSASIGSAIVNGDTLQPRKPPGHIVIPAGALRRGDNIVTLTFTSGDEALNRNDEFLYALFVPDRASTAFPSFDQPDIKARYTLSLDVPSGWRAIANGAEKAVENPGSRTTYAFEETQPISTYLFSFAAGKFSVEEAERNGRTFTMLHRETDSAKVARNRDAIFDLHATALTWLEAYTQIRYPFGKFAFVAVPSFQFGGMEHPGAVWYRASSLFLDESATQNQYLGRASLIAHETAHMWFGDLVTMRWFDDVWMKEVFANFMAAKIVQPSFPDINHDLRFVLAHHPAAYGVDRTRGANSIRQPLENLRQAGSLYGAIIYQKAPIVMRQLERMVGDSVFREGIQRYLTRYKFGNASWPELVSILDDLSPHDLRSWSRVWVEEPGRPQVSASWADGTITIRQDDPEVSRARRWQQQLTVVHGYGDRIVQDTVTVVTDSAVITTSSSVTPDFILVGADASSYGRFILDSASRRVLLQRVPTLSDPIHRATATSALWESVLSGETVPADFLNTAMRALDVEQEELVAQQLLGFVRTTWWRLLADSTRRSLAPAVEASLWAMLERAQGTSRKSAFWSTIVSVTSTETGLEKLRTIWERQEPPRGLPLSEQQYTSLVEELVIRGAANARAMLDSQAARITNPDRKERFAFIRPSLSSSSEVRDSVFQSLLDVTNRRRESWATEALRNLNHPTRAPHAVRYIRRGLDVVDEIQRTGDIFFPLSWMNALLDGHSSIAAAENVVTFLDETPNQQPRLRGKTLQAADDLFRAARILHGWDSGPPLEGESSITGMRSPATSRDR